MFLKILVLPLAFVASLVLSSLTACDKEPDTPDTTAKPKYNYFPLEVGNYWIFELDSVLVGSHYFFKDTILVTEQLSIKGDIAYLVENPFLFYGHHLLVFDYETNDIIYSWNLCRDTLPIDKFVFIEFISPEYQSDNPRHFDYPEFCPHV